MRKCISLLIFCFSVSSLFAEGADFLNYPSIINNGDVFIDFGVGFGGNLRAKMQCPPISLGIDYALPIAALPFTVGGILAFSTEQQGSIKSTNLGYALRLAYHLGWGVDRLDTYGLLTIGGITEWVNDGVKGDFWMGVGVGARYFFLPFFGAYLEAGIDKLQYISFGLAFKL